VPAASLAADNKNDPKTVQTECVRAWDRCWDGCKGKGNNCYKGCNDKYDICLNIEMEMDAPANAQDGGGASPKPKGPKGAVGSHTGVLSKP
jgi:hypothetical protein